MEKLIEMKKLIDLKTGTMFRRILSISSDEYRVGTKYDDKRIGVRNMTTKESFLFPGDLWVIVISIPKKKR